VGRATVICETTKKGFTMFIRRMAVTSAALLLAGGLSACASTSSTDAGAPAPSTSPSSSTPTGCPVLITDQWVKAADSGMTAGFAHLGNPTDQDLTITAASSPSATAMELHEVVDKDGEMMMQPVDGGFTVPAGGHLHLEPGGYHLMFMGLPEPIDAGEEVEITLTCADGSTTSFTAPAKPFTGAEEEYAGEGMDGMDHSGEMDHDHSESPSPMES
jgi:copper(I)-binding protein